MLFIRKNLIKKHFFEFTFNEEDEEDDDQIVLPDKTLFDKLTSKELNYLVEIYNWDDGVEVLNWVIDSPKCDLGTAKLIFWNAAPDFYFEYTKETIDPYELPILELLQKIIAKINANDFPLHKIKYNSKANANFVESKFAKGIWELPVILTT